MSPVKACTIAVVTALTPVSSFAATPNPDATKAAIAQPAPNITAAVAFKNIIAETQSTNNASANMPNNFGEADNFLSRIRNNRINNLGMGIQRTMLYMGNDRASFNVYVPTESVNRVLSVAKAIPQSPLEDTHAALIQTLLLLSKQQINTKLAYSVKLDGHSNFDSAIVCRLNTDSGTGKFDVAANVRFSSRF